MNLVLSPQIASFYSALCSGSIASAVRVSGEVNFAREGWQLDPVLDAVEFESSLQGDVSLLNREDFPWEERLDRFDQSIDQRWQKLYDDLTNALTDRRGPIAGCNFMTAIGKLDRDEAKKIGHWLKVSNSPFLSRWFLGPPELIQAIRQVVGGVETFFSAVDPSTSLFSIGGGDTPSVANELFRISGLRMVEVAGGEYPIGKGWADALAPAIVTLPAFLMGETPVTNGAFRNVLQELGDRNAMWVGQVSNKDWVIFMRDEPEAIDSLTVEEKREMINRKLNELSRRREGVELYGVEKVLGNLGQVVLQDRISEIGERAARFSGNNQPVVMQDWYESLGFALLLGKGLPPEVYWEAAARGRAGLPFGTETGMLTPSLAHYNQHGSRGATAGVGSKPANPQGLFDMTGNVLERMIDYYLSNDCRVLRGGSWRNSSSGWLRTAFRHGCTPLGGADDIGFRLFAPQG